MYLLTPTWITVTTPGSNWEMIGEWPKLTPYSPAAPGNITLSTTFLLNIGKCGVTKLIINSEDDVEEVVAVASAIHAVDDLV